MARTTPVHSGYSIINGSGTGSNGNRIDVWIEYRVGDADVANNRTWFTAYFYAALNPNYTSSTSYYKGLNSTFSVNGTAAGSVTDGAYDFTSTAKVNLLGSFDGWIAHGADGKKSLSLSGSFTTASSYISGGSISGTVTLPVIPRAAAVTGHDSTLGNACRVSWTPAAASHSFTLTFSLGSWQRSTGRLYPNKASAYTYAGTALPLEAARQFAGSTAQMRVTLTTYDGGTVLGTREDTFTVTVPENDHTRPSVTASLTPVGSAFSGLYMQKLCKVSAAVNAADPLGATITGYTIATEGAPKEGTISGYLDKAGLVTVTVTAKNSRGFTGSWSGQITVTPYNIPCLLSPAAYRCLSDGAADPGGTFLRITAGWSCSPVEGKNSCSLRWRYRREGESWSDWNKVTATDHVDTGAMTGIVLEKTEAYTVELEAEDTAGGSATAVFSIPVEKVYMHRTRDAMGLGGYADGTDLLDIHWNVQARQGINGVYIRRAVISGSRQLRLQSRFSKMEGAGNNRQSVFLFGNDNHTLISGVLGVSDAGGVKWNGTSGVTAAANTATGIVTVTLPYVAYDQFVLISGDPIEVV